MGLFKEALNQHQQEATAERVVYRSIEKIRQCRPDIYWADRYRRLHASKSAAGPQPSRAK